MFYNDDGFFCKHKIQWSFIALHKYYPFVGNFQKLHKYYPFVGKFWKSHKYYPFIGKPFFMVIETFQSPQKGGVSYVFGKPSSRTFKKTFDMPNKGFSKTYDTPSFHGDWKVLIATKRGNRIFFDGHKVGK